MRGKLTALSLRLPNGLNGQPPPTFSRPPRAPTIQDAVLQDSAQLHTVAVAASLRPPAILCVGVCVSRWQGPGPQGPLLAKLWNTEP